MSNDPTITGFIVFEERPGDGEGRNALIAAVKSAIRTEEVAAGRRYDERRFVCTRLDDHLDFMEWEYSRVLSPA